jgi:hypothetical protein
MAKPYVEDPLIRSMRVRTWFQAVSMASGKTPAQLEREFSEREDPIKTTPRSCIWEKYRRGEVVPRLGVRENSRSNLAERVEVRYPQTKKWLTSPLWRAADKAPMSIRDIRAAYESLAPDIASLFVADDVGATEVFWRRPLNAEAVCGLLGRSSRVDAIAALALMVKEAEMAQNQPQHRIAVSAATQRMSQLGGVPALGEVLPELFRYVTDRWKSVRYITTQTHSDLPLFR